MKLKCIDTANQLSIKSIYNRNLQLPIRHNYIYYKFNFTSTYKYSGLPNPKCQTDIKDVYFNRGENFNN